MRLMRKRRTNRAAHFVSVLKVSSGKKEHMERRGERHAREGTQREGASR